MFASAVVAQAADTDTLAKMRQVVKEEFQVVKEEVKEVIKEEVKEEVQQFVKIIRPITDAVFGQPAHRATTVQTRESVKDTAAQHHSASGCLILQHVFGPEVAEQYEFCAAHIYDKSNRKAAAALGIDIDSPRNILILLRAFEIEFDNGNMMFIPCEEADGQRLRKRARKSGMSFVSENLLLQVFVRESLRREEVWTLKNNNLQKEKRVSVRGRQLLFGDVHETKIKAAPVYMRALFEKCMGAFKKPGEPPGSMPNPYDYLDCFQARCNSWEAYFDFRWTDADRQVGSAPVEQVVDDSD